MNDQPTQSSTIHYQHWWGLAAIALLMGLIGLVAPYGAHIEFAEDKGAFDYYWKLPERDYWASLSAWTLYAMHQLAIWVIIYKAQHAKLTYSNKLHPLNLWAMGVNGLFILLHIAQTKWGYDGLAQDVHEGTALLSVVFMLLIIFIMENDRRGLFFGKKAPGMKTQGSMLRKYHGYYFAWATTYTFWYHPIETTAGHLFGFFYMFMLFLQGSLFLTKFHVNRWWTVTLETFFIFHGATVAYFAIKEEGVQWSTFLFGGFGIFIVTHMHGLGLSLKQKLLTAAVLLSAAASFYAFNLELAWNMPRQMFMRYLMIFIFAGLIWLGMQPFIYLNRKKSL